MKSAFVDLVRQSLTRPAEAARVLVALKLSNAEVLQATALLAVLSVIARYGLFGFLVAYSPTPVGLTDYNVVADLAMQFGGVYLAILTIIILARGMGARVAFADAAAVYIWFNLMLTLASFVMLLAFYALGSIAVLVSAAVGIWGLWAMAHFWAVLVARDNLLVGLGLGLVSVLIASSVTVVVVGVLNLPVMEITANV